tara:strand:+ start:466 stop:1008 length:543 start_codon:yes stop_codon:yes gene_type:complete
MQKCIKCSNEKEIVHFDVKQNGERYKTCNECREKGNNKRTKVNSTNEETKKRENRPSISFQTKQEILKEQNYCCRGPNKNDNNEYECDMNINGKKFCDRKASEPQFDHIIRWKEGGNGIENIQALCASCHLMKTSMENIVNENDECPSDRVKVILNSLRKPKYQKKKKNYKKKNKKKLRK